MPAPSNQTAATAIVISSLPYAITMDVADQTNTLQMWWRYTSVTTANTLGFLAFADVTSLYAPKVTLYTGPNSSSLTAYPIGAGIVASQKQIAFPVVGGDTYWFKVEQTGAGTPLGASLILSGYAGPATSAPIGSLFVNDTNIGYAGVILDATTGAVDQFMPNLAIGDMGVVLPGGAFALEQFDPTFTSPSTVRVYAADHTLVATVTVTGNLYALAADHGTTFFIASASAAFPTDAAATVTTISAAGVVGGTTWTLPANSSAMAMMAVNAARTILYYATAVVNVPIHRYDLVGNAPLSDLVAGIANHSLVQDLLVLADDTLVAGYSKNSATKDYEALHYSAAGATLNTYSFGTAPKIDRMALGTDDPTSMWLRLWPDPTTSNTSFFRNLKISDGSTIHDTPTLDSFDNGRSVLGYVGYPGGNPPPWGPASTCPFFLTRTAAGPPAPPGPPVVPPVFVPLPPGSRPPFTSPPYPALPPGGAYVLQDPLRRLRQAPHLDDKSNGKRIFYPGAQLIFEAGGPRETDESLFFELQWSDDGGHTWSNLHRIEAGSLGQYRFRAIWRRLGSSRDRVFRVIESNAAKVVLVDFYLDPDPTQGLS
jgi:hypothetical protein